MTIIAEFFKIKNNVKIIEYKIKQFFLGGWQFRFGSGIVWLSSFLNRIVISEISYDCIEDKA